MKALVNGLTIIPAFEVIQSSVIVCRVMKRFSKSYQSASRNSVIVISIPVGSASLAKSRKTDLTTNI